MHFRSRFRPQNLNFGVPQKHFASLGSILVTWSGPGDPKADPRRKREVFWTFSPSLWIPISAHFWQTNHEKSTPISFCLWLASNTNFLKKILEKRATWHLQNVTKNIVNTISDAMLPCCSKRSKEQCPGRHFGGLWCHCGVTLGAKWDARGGSSRGRNSDGKKVPAGAGKSRQEQGGSP